MIKLKLHRKRKYILNRSTYTNDLYSCMMQHRFTCRSVEYNYVTLQCHLSDSDRRTTGQYVQFVEAQGVDYFENLCIKGNVTCDIMYLIFYKTTTIYCDVIILWSSTTYRPYTLHGLYGRYRYLRYILLYYRYNKYLLYHRYHCIILTYAYIIFVSRQSSLQRKSRIPSAQDRSGRRQSGAVRLVALLYRQGITGNI